MFSFSSKIIYLLLPNFIPNFFILFYFLLLEYD